MTVAAHTGVFPCLPDYSVASAIWVLTVANSIGDNFTLPAFSDKCIQVEGTFNAATVIVTGSNDGTTFYTLHDPLGNAISFTSGGLKQILENPLYIKPSCSGGASTQSITCTLMVHGVTNKRNP